GHAVLERLKVDPELVRAAGPAAIGGILAAVHIGLGIVEADCSLHSDAPLSIIDELTRLSTEAQLDEPLSVNASEAGGLTELERGLVAHQLRLVFHLARGERSQAEARIEPRHLQAGMQYQFEILRNVVDCKMSQRTVDVAGMRRCVEIFTHYVAQ